MLFPVRLNLSASLSSEILAFRIYKIQVSAKEKNFKLYARLFPFIWYLYFCKHYLFFAHSKIVYLNVYTHTKKWNADPNLHLNAY